MSRAVRRGYRFGIIPQWVLYHPDLSDRAVRLFGVLDRHVGAEEACWPSRARLAELMGCSVDSVDRAKAELVAAQAITVERRVTDAGDRDTNLYVLYGDPPDGVEDPVGGPGDSSVDNRGGSRRAAATGGRRAAARGGRTGAAGKESQVNETPPTPPVGGQDQSRSPGRHCAPCGAGPFTLDQYQDHLDAGCPAEEDLDQLGARALDRITSGRPEATSDTAPV